MTSTFVNFTCRTAIGLLTFAIATLVTWVSLAAAEPEFRFEKAACPKMPVVIPELKTARCGRLTVPENRRQPNGRTISLSVAIIPAASANLKPDPIVWLAGGPGDDAITEIPMALAGDLNRNRDVIFMSQRGTYSARPSLTCDGVDRFPAETLDKPFDAPETGQAFAKATADCRHRLEALGVDLSAYNTIESSDDVEDLRLALGIEQWNLFGI